MRSEELHSLLATAADDGRATDVPLDAIHARHRAMRRHRLVAVSTVAVMVLIVAGIGSALLMGGGTAEVKTASGQVAADPPGPGPGGVGGVPQPAGCADPPDTGSSSHYYKATTRMTIGSAPVTPSSVPEVVDQAMSLIDDAAFLQGVAGDTGRCPAWVARHVAVSGDVDRALLDVTAIGTDPDTTVRLADAVASRLAARPAASSVGPTISVSMRAAAVEINEPGFEARLTRNVDRMDGAGR